MVTAGSKGGSVNIVQMVGTLGQQNVDGKRVQHGFEGRVLPHSTRYDDGADARGFVSSSFAKGLNPQEFVFHCMGGRVGLIDTAVRTSECGYISRKLIKAMEDAKIHHDGTVRNAVGHVIQTLYGEDGFDSTSIEVHQVVYDGWSPEKMADAYLLTEHHPPPEWMTPKARGAWLERMGASPVGRERLESNFRDVLADQEFLRSRRGGDKVLYPVAVQRIVANAVSRQRISRPAGFPSDLDPLDALDELDRLLDLLVPVGNAPQSPIFAAILRMHLSPKPLLALGCTAATLSAICEAVVTRYGDSLAQPGEMVGVIAAQSIGEPTTQLTLNCVSRSTEVVVERDGRVFVAELGDLADGSSPKP
jgi:DNA-directed RNA polymerase II subunit RPB1